jgi:hypothetical protein
MTHMVAVHLRQQAQVLELRKVSNTTVVAIVRLLVRRRWLLTYSCRANDTRSRRFPIEVRLRVVSNLSLS